ncbi:hypothetical protein TURU_140344 [Turdus rufiventris]|nr:hypothetical protein TURU_140344 [Turdus rufiventris]
MRDMQRFHQDTRGWDDIGYSFVVGSDGYLYEGRGWHWVGAHTKGYNTQGFGIGIVGDFTTTLPDPDTLSLVRDELLPCAVRSGHIWPDFTLRGHRQLGHTDCPGNALFQEIQSWPGFQGTPVPPGLGLYFNTPQNKLFNDFIGYRSDTDRPVVSGILFLALLENQDNIRQLPVSWADFQSDPRCELCVCSDFSRRSSLCTTCMFELLFSSGNVFVGLMEDIDG